MVYTLIIDYFDDLVLYDHLSTMTTVYLDVYYDYPPQPVSTMTTVYLDHLSSMTTVYLHQCLL